jgi:ParB family chromosome partitioning protein
MSDELRPEGSESLSEIQAELSAERAAKAAREVRRLPIDAVRVPPGREPRGVEHLADSIRTVGQLQPIGVIPGPGEDEYTAVFGVSRLAAQNSIGAAMITAVVLDPREIVADLSEADPDLTQEEKEKLAVELMEIDENLRRASLPALQERRQLQRRKAIYERLYPETRRGAAGGKASGEARRGEVRTNDKVSFVQDTASKTGESKRTVERAIHVAEHLDPEVDDLIRGTPLENSKTGLDDLVRLPREDQKALVRSGLAELGPEKLTNGNLQKIQVRKRAEETERQAEDGVASEEAKRESKLPVKPETGTDLQEGALDTLGLRSEIYNCLKKLNIQTVGDLVQKTEAELMAMHGFEPAGLDEVREKLAQCCLCLAEPESATEKTGARQDWPVPPDGDAPPATWETWAMEVKSIIEREWSARAACWLAWAVVDEERTNPEFRKRLRNLALHNGHKPRGREKPAES